MLGLNFSLDLVPLLVLGGPARAPHSSLSYAVFAWDIVGKGMQLLHGIKWDLKQKKQGVIAHALFKVI